MDPNQMLQLNLTLGEVNMVLTSLGKLPYEAVMELLPKIQRQAQAQLQSAQEPQGVVEPVKE